MRFSGFARPTLLALGLAVLPLATGCGSNPFNPPIIDDGGGLPPDTPMNDTPANTMTRFERTYEKQVLDQYELLFASNFRFTFSNQSDPTLVSQYGNNWGKDDEVESTSHLFDGFTNDGGDFIAGASAITLDLPGLQIIDDPTANPDSGNFFKLVIVPTISLTLDVPGTDGFVIAAPHNFYLVRGDAAVLDESQEASSTRWYIRRWDDLSPALASVSPRLSSVGATVGGRPASTSWGNLKGSYAGTK